MKIKEETKAIVESLLKSDELSTIDKYELIANIQIIDYLITDTLKFVEFLFNLYKENEDKTK